MRTARRLLAGLGAFVVLVVLLVGVPLALTLAVGWPLPHSWPTASQANTLLSTSGIPDVVLIDTLAVVCWLAWLDFALAVLVECGAAARRRAAPRLLLARPWQPLASHLVTAVAIAITAMSARTGTTRAPHSVPLVTALAAAQHSTATVPRTTVESRSAIDAGAVAPTPATQPEYVVKGGDTLWDISGHRLGDPRRWPEIWHRNQDRGEPGGRVFTDPNLIVPGWELDLPAAKAPRPAPPAASPAPSGPGRPSGVSPSAPSGSGTGVEQPRPFPPSAQAPSNPSHGVAPTGPNGSGEAAPVPSSSSAIHLPTGGVVGLSLAAAIAAALATARLHERRRRRIGSPSHAGVGELAGPSVAALQSALADLTQQAVRDGAPAPVADAAALREVLRRCAAAPGRLPVGPAHEGAGEVTVDTDELSGVALIGPGAARAARAVVVATLAHHRAHTAGVLIVGGTAALIAGLGDVPGVDAVTDLATALPVLEAEVIRRGRVLADHDVDDYRATAETPDPLETLLVFVDGGVVRSHARRLETVVRLGRALGIGVVAVGEAEGFEPVGVAVDGILAAGATVGFAGRLFVLSDDEAGELLAVIAAGRGATLVEGPSAGADAAARDDAREVTPPSLERATSAEAELRPVQLALFGQPRVLVLGTEVMTGLRRKARVLLALLAVRPDGVTLEEALDTLWHEEGDARADRGDFQIVVNDTRRRLRDLSGRVDGRFIVFGGDRYRLDTSLVDADLWRFEEALRAAAGADSDATRTDALALAAVSATGEPLAGIADAWAEPIREHLRRRAVDALAELAQLREVASDAVGAVAALEQALTVEPCCEDVYRRLIALQQRCGREDAARRAYRALTRELAELGAEPDDETEALLASPAKAAPSADTQGRSMIAARQVVNKGAQSRQPRLSILDDDPADG